MSPLRMLAVVRARPHLAALAAMILLLASLGAIPTTTAQSSNPTSSPDVIVDAGQSGTASYSGSVLGQANVVVYGVEPRPFTSYDFTLNNLSGSPSTIYLLSPNGATISGGVASAYNDPDHTGKRAATFPAITFPAAGIFRLVAENTTGTLLGAVYVHPITVQASVSPNPVYASGGAGTFTVTVTHGGLGIANATLQHPILPAGAKTGSDGTYTYSGPVGNACVCHIEVSKQSSNQTTNGIDVEEYEGLAVLTVQTVTTTVRIGHVQGSILHPALAPIRIDNVTDFGSATVELAYDPSVVTVTNVTAGNVPNATLTWSVNATSGLVTLLVTTNARPGVNGSFELAVVELTAAGSAGANTTLDLSLEELVDSNGTAMGANVVDGSYRAGILGDADGDGDVDANDVLAISEVVVGKRPASSIVAVDADVSRDGVVTGKDAMFLSQHLAGTRPTL